MRYEISYDIAAALIFVVIASLFYSKKKSPYHYNVVFGILVASCLLTAVFDIFGALVISSPQVPLWVAYPINIIYALLQHAIAPIYAWYMVVLTRSVRNVRPLYIRMLVYPYCVELLLILTTPLTKLMFFYNADRIYTHGPCFNLVYAVNCYYFLLGFFFLLRYSKSLSYDKKLALYSFIPVVGGGVVFQVIFPSYLIQIFCISVSITLLLFSVQNAEELLDNATGAFNSDAFLTANKSDMITQTKFLLIAVEICNMDVIGRTVGLDKTDHILRKVVKYLNSIHPKGVVGRISDGTFGLKLPATVLSQKQKLAETIASRFTHAYIEAEVPVHYRIRITCIACPEEASSIEQMMEILTYVSTYCKENNIYYGNMINQGALNRDHEIRRAIKEAIANQGFEVYYQPIYSVQKKRITSAEALIRLNDKKLGFISPEIFIPMAEQEGSILEIGKFVFETVCRFYQENHLGEKGIEYIEVNLSVIECMQHDLADRLMSITQKYGLPPVRINLEITETAMANSIDALRSTMQKLSDYGFSFSMDDYGTGYSNISSAYDLPFQYIKIDKSILWTSMENEKAYAVLKNTFSMVKTIEKKIIMEGVETEEHINRLLELGCDYFQGYYFSKPVPGEQFVKYLDSFQV